MKRGSLASINREYSIFFIPSHVANNPRFSPRKVLQVLKSALEAQPQLPPHSHSRQPAPKKLSLATDVTATPVTPNLAGSDRPNSSHVLIVDDNEINIKVLSKLMSKLGYEYKTATNGLLALNKYKESPEAFKMVLMGKKLSSTLYYLSLTNKS